MFKRYFPLFCPVLSSEEDTTFFYPKVSEGSPSVPLLFIDVTYGGLATGGLHGALHWGPQAEGALGT